MDLSLLDMFTWPNEPGLGSRNLETTLLVERARGLRISYVSGRPQNSHQRS